MTVEVERGLSGNDLHIWGNYPLAGNSVTARIARIRPCLLLAATLFRDALRARGIVISGSVNRRISAPQEFPDGRGQIAG
jgi:hypothetical protein